MQDTLKLLDERPLNENNIQDDLYSLFPHKKVLDSLKNVIDSYSEEIKNKVILLSGRWGTGKTSVLKKLKRKKDEALFIEFDAWSSNYDMILKEFLRKFFDKTECSILKGKVDTIEKKSIFPISKITIAFYLLIFLGLPLFKDVYPRYMDHNIPIFITVITLLLLITLSKNAILKHLFPMFNGTIQEHSEYSEQSDISPQKVQNLLEKYKEEHKKDQIIITIDNLDRLSIDHQKTYLDALYIFINEINKLDLNIWFIIALDKDAIISNENISLSIFDKISPYEIALPMLDDTTVELYFRQILEENLSQINEWSDQIDYAYLIKIYHYFINRNFPPSVLAKYPLKAHHQLQTPRTIKKIYNQMTLIYNENLDISNTKKLLTTSFYLACARVFNCIDQIKYLFDYRDIYEKKQVDSYNIKDRLNNNPSGLTKDEEREKEIEEKASSNFNDTLYNIFSGSSVDIDLFKEILYNKKLPSKDDIKNFYQLDNFFTIMLRNIDIYGIDALRDNIQKAVKEHYEQNKNVEIIIKTYDICKVKNDYSIFSDEWSTKILSMIDFESITTTLWISAFTMLYIKSSERKTHEDEFKESLSKIKNNEKIYDLLAHFNDAVDVFQENENLISVLDSYATHMILERVDYYILLHSPFLDKLSLDLRYVIYSKLSDNHISDIIQKIAYVDRVEYISMWLKEFSVNSNFSENVLVPLLQKAINKYNDQS
ncbi:MAG: P-loop NTPase fold protein, partial [Brevinema sp.]